MRRRALAPVAVAVAVAVSGATACGGRDDRSTEARPAAPAAGEARSSGRRAIAAGDVRRHLRALQRIADRHDGTRATGTPGEEATIAYVARELRRAGWRVAFHELDVPVFRLRGPARVSGLRARDLAVLRFSGSGTVTGTVRPMDTDGCAEAALGEIERGDVVLLARGTCTFRTKARNAERAGAGALLVVDDESPRPVRGTLGEPGTRIPVLAVTRDAAARLARRRVPVRVEVDAVSRTGTVRDVLAETPGTSGRVVMAGAHLDSVPAGPGLNDNGSGIAALLAVAGRLSARPGVRLGFWAAEESGLHGSRAYVRSLSAAERRRVVAYVNLDMVGSPRPRPQVYDTDDRVERVLRRSLAGREGETDVGAASDHAPFARAGIAVGGLFTGASPRTDPCYHRACDRLGNVNVPTVVRMARATQDALAALRPRPGAA